VDVEVPVSSAPAAEAIRSATALKMSIILNEDVDEPD
jgi:hypothetical protein